MCLYIFLVRKSKRGHERLPWARYRLTNIFIHVQASPGLPACHSGAEPQPLGRLYQNAAQARRVRGSKARRGGRSAGSTPSL